MRWSQVRARRLARNGLTTPLGSIPEVARTICGVHAQVMSAAEISIAVRLDGATSADVRSALWTERSLVKTYGPRGTVHLLASADLPLWCGALAAVPKVSGLTSSVLTGNQQEQVIIAVGAVLTEANQPLIMEELSAAVIERTGAWAGDLVIPAFQGAWPRWRRAIDSAAHRGALIFAEPRGRSVTFAGPQHWVPGFAPAEPSVALPWLLRSYLRSYGPARPADYARWLATTASWAKEQFTAGDLVPVDLAGEPAWSTADDPAVDGSDALGELAGLRLLPYFDSYVVASQPRELVYPGPAAARALRQGQAGNYPVLLRDGEVAGVWHRKAAGRRAVITVEPLLPLSDWERDRLENEVERLAWITGTESELVLGPVAVGPHA